MPILKKPTPGAADKPAPAVPAKPTPGVKPPVKPAAAAPKRDAFAERYATTEAATGGGYIPPLPGTYQALITEGQGVIDGEKTAAYLELTIADDENEQRGKTTRIYYNFTDAEGQEMQGLPYFKADMTQLGVEEDFTSWQDMVDTLAQIAEQQIWVIINVVKKGKNTNVYLASVPENQDEKPTID